MLRRASPRGTSRSLFVSRRSARNIILVSAYDPTRLGGIDEIAEDEATGTISLAYEQVRSILGVPFVPTIYRMAATHESVFVKALGRLAPVLSVQRERGFIHEAELVARQALKSPSEGRFEGGLDLQVSLLIQRYSTANPLNLLFALGLLGTGVVECPSVMSPPLPARSDDVYTDILNCHGGVTIPGFWRELGQRPELLELVWSATRAQAEHGRFDAARRAVLEFGAETIRNSQVSEILSDISLEDMDQIHQLIGWFPTGIATMIAETEWLKFQNSPVAPARD